MKEVESILYTDPQTRPHIGFCCRCGGVLYAPSLVCIRCGRDMP